MRVAYVTVYDARDITQMSGSEHFVLRALQGASLDIELIGPLPYRWPNYHEWKRLLYERGLHQKYRKERVQSVVRHYGSYASSALRHLDIDVVFSPSPMAIAYVDCPQPIVFYHDATFEGLRDYYSNYTSMCWESRRYGHAIDQAALTRSTLAVYTSQWAAQTALDHYSVGPDKVRVVPRGANIEHPPTTEQVSALIEARQFQECRLLFVGRSWKRKGGAFALQVLAGLLDRGLAARLTIVGCRPEIPPELAPHVSVLGLMAKSDPRQEADLERAYGSSHFMVLPTTAECFGLAAAEASAYGLPVLAMRTGGVPEAVRDDANGRLFSLAARPAEYCDYVVGTYSDRERYRGLAKSAREEFETRLNWRTNGAALAGLIEEAAGGTARSAGRPSSS